MKAYAPRIIAAAKASAIARYYWKDRGPACIGYTSGMAVAYASAYARLQAHDPVTDRMSRALEPAYLDNQGHLKGDALTWCADQLRAIGMGTATPLERLRSLFVLLLGLGMRESSGRCVEGRDQSANNMSADTAEAGLFQVSFNLVAGRAELLDIVHHYQRDQSLGLADIFKEGMSPPTGYKDEDVGTPGSPGYVFQGLAKKCPAMAIEIAALGLRLAAGHWGPIVRHAAEIRSASRELLMIVEGIIDTPAVAAAAQGIQYVAATIAAGDGNRANTARKYLERVDIASLLPINEGVSSATEGTMVSLLGSPRMPLTTTDQPERASDFVKRYLVTARMSALFRLTGLKLAVADVKEVLGHAFAEHPDLENVLSTAGMLNVRMRKPTDGSVSKYISNHAWGTAVDFKVVGYDAPANTGQTVPTFIAILIPLFNKAGWYSGVGFHDTMHFEVSEERIRKWSAERAYVEITTS